MLFAEKSKALNFIRFNYDEIYDMSGKAPCRAYFCSSCAGWHVTSRESRVSFRKKARTMLNHAKRNLYEARFAACRRFLSYAEKFMKKEYWFHDKIDADICVESEIRSVAVKMRNNFIYRMYNTSDQSSCVKPELEPFIIRENEKVSILAVGRGNLSPEKVEEYRSEQHVGADAAVCKLILHELRIVDVVKSNDKSDFDCTYYDSINEMFNGEILDVWCKGFSLNVLEKYMGSKSKNNYMCPKNLDFWIRLGDRSVRCFSGRGRKYTCFLRDFVGL